MKINVGSKNQPKVQAVTDAVKLYPNLFPNPEVVGVEVNVETFGHPKTLAETVEGAVSRAKQAFKDCVYSFGLESGLVPTPETRSGYLEISIAAVYDGKNIYLGSAAGFEWPKKVTEMVASGKADASKAFKELALTQHEKLGAMEGGIIGFLTKGRMTRERQVMDSIITALIHLENPELY
jgi:inosine/xanthosine triphosphatase